MLVSRRLGSRIVLVVWAFFALPHDALAGFEWIGWWDEHSQGNGSFNSSGFELPDGVLGVKASIQGQLQHFGSDPPIDRYAKSSIVLSRHFRLTGSPGGWQVDLDWHVVESVRMTVHVSYSGSNPTMKVSTTDNFQDPISMPYFLPHRSIFLPDGDYLFTLGASGTLTFSQPPPWILPPGSFSTYFGMFRYEFSASLKVTAVPEPAPWLMIGQGLVAIAGIIFVSKRRKPGSGRPGSEETSGILDGFETSGIEGVRS
jgi:hypothetical protein